MSILILYGGDLAKDIAERICEAGKAAAAATSFEVVSMEQCKKGIEPGVATVICVLQTVENAEAPESAGRFTRFMKRNSHPTDLLSSSRATPLAFTVLALGDSNLLMDRQTTTAKDCNQVAQKLDARLAELGATAFCARGEADDRTGNQEIAPWLERLQIAMAQARAA